MVCHRDPFQLAKHGSVRFHRTAASDCPATDGSPPLADSRSNRHLCSLMPAFVTGLELAISEGLAVGSSFYNGGARILAKPRHPSLGRCVPVNCGGFFPGRLASSAELEPGATNNLRVRRFPSWIHLRLQSRSVKNRYRVRISGCGRIRAQTEVWRLKVIALSSFRASFRQSDLFRVGCERPFENHVLRSSDSCTGRAYFGRDGCHRRRRL